MTAQPLDVNLWSEAAHAADYIERRRSIPHREEGYAALLEFLYATGARVSEAVGCAVDDLDLAEGTVLLRGWMR